MLCFAPKAVEHYLKRVNVCTLTFACFPHSDVTKDFQVFEELKDYIQLFLCH